MLQQLGFLPQRQFHVLIYLPGQVLNLTVLPHNDGHFRVIEHGEVLGEWTLHPTINLCAAAGSSKKALWTSWSST